MTKAAKIALGIGVAGVGCAGLAVASTGVVRLAWAWTAASCAAATASYRWNRPDWLGKRGGRMSGGALLLLPYLVAIRIAYALIRWWRGPDAPTLVGPGLWVGGRLARATFPAPVTHVVDLVAEYGAPGWARALPGYRSLPILDGGAPPDAGAFVDLVQEARDVDGDVLVHCDSGRGRAPTFAAALLIARGVAPDVATALSMMRARRPVASPTRSDVVFLEGLTARLRTPDRREEPRRRSG